MATRSPTPTHSASGGCYICRRMKVKCDRELPECARCRKAGRTCPGYRAAVDNFISMNRSTIRKAQSRDHRTQSREPSPMPRSQSAPAWTFEESEHLLEPSNQLNHEFLSPTSVPVNFLVPPITLDWENQAVHGFLNSFCNESSLTTDWLSYLPGLYNDNPQDASFDNAIKAVSFMHLARRTCMTVLMVQARRYYGKALLQASAQLNIRNQTVSDHLLAALVLLDLYEMMAGDKPLIHAWETHSAGQAMLLKVRGESQFQTQRGKQMYASICNFLHVKDLAQKRSPTFILSTFPGSVHDYPQAAEAAKLIARIATLQKEGWTLIEEAQKGSIDQARILLLLGESIAAERNIATWKTTCPPHWQPSVSPYHAPYRSNSPGSRSNQYFPREIHHFIDLSVAGLWCSIDAARIRLLQTIIECTIVLGAPAVQNSPAFSRATLTQQILGSVDSIGNTLPYLLGDLDDNGHLCVPPNSRPADGLLALWPLHVCVLIRDTEEPYFDWLLAQLERVGKIVGCGRSIGLGEYQRQRFAGMAMLPSVVEA